MWPAGQQKQAVKPVFTTPPYSNTAVRGGCTAAVAKITTLAESGGPNCC